MTLGIVGRSVRITFICLASKLIGAVAVTEIPLLHRFHREYHSGTSYLGVLDLDYQETAISVSNPPLEIPILDYDDLSITLFRKLSTLILRSFFDRFHFHRNYHRFWHIFQVGPSRKMATVDAETKALAAAGLSFLSLPPEVRNMIYRMLLVADKPLACSKDERECDFPGDYNLRWANLGEYHIQPAMLRVCWQVYREASSILNCENTFGIRIRDLTFHDGTGTVSSFRNPWITDGLSSFWDSDMDKFQRLEIYIEGSKYRKVRSSVRELCRCYLSKSHELQHLTIYLYELFGQVDHKILGPFGMLQNLRSVEIHGAPRKYSQNLKRLILGKTPPENLCGMYLMLEQYVEEVNGDCSDLEKASKAMRNSNVQKFKEIRSKIVSDNQDRIDYALHHLFDFESKGNEDHQVADVTMDDATATLKDGHGPQAGTYEGLKRSMKKSLGIVKKRSRKGSRRKKR